MQGRAILPEAPNSLWGRRVAIIPHNSGKPASGPQAQKRYRPEHDNHQKIKVFWLGA